MKLNINLFRIDCEGTIEMLRDYQITMETQLVQIQKQETARVTKLLGEIEDDDDHYIHQDIAADEYHYTYEVMFPRSMRYSFIVLLFLNLEDLLNRFCDHIKERDNISIRSIKLKGDSVERSRTYLHRLARVPGLDSAIWECIEDLSKVRNCIVHTLGKVDQSSDQMRIKDIAKQGIGLTIGDSDILESGQIVLTPDYCRKAVNDASVLIRELFDKAGFGPARGF